MLWSRHSLLLEAQYQVSEMLLNAQEENTLETSESHATGGKKKKITKTE